MMGASRNYGYHFRGPNNQDYSMLGSILGPPRLGTLPYIKALHRDFAKRVFLFAWMPIKRQEVSLFSDNPMQGLDRSPSRILNPKP